MVDEEIDKYLDIIEEEAAAQSIELDVDLAIEFAEELFLNELDEEAFDELVRRIEESGRFEPTFGPGEVKPTLDHTELMENGGDDEIVEEPGEPGLDDLPEADEEY